MFKILGLVLIYIAVFIAFNIKIFQAYLTHLFLIENIALAEQMKTACLLGKTYKSLFDSFNCNRFVICKNLLDSNRVNAVDSFFTEAGRRNKKAEWLLLDEDDMD